MALPLRIPPPSASQRSEAIGRTAKRRMVARAAAEIEKDNTESGITAPVIVGRETCMASFSSSRCRCVATRRRHDRRLENYERVDRVDARRVGHCWALLDGGCGNAPPPTRSSPAGFSEHLAVARVEALESISPEVDMRRRWVGLALGTMTLVAASAARAEEVGCCEAECHAADGSGGVLHSVQRRDMTQAECESQFEGCVTRWGGGGCDEQPGGVGFGIRGGMPRDPGGGGE
jgi:hypothetical protein